MKEEESLVKCNFLSFIGTIAVMRPCRLRAEVSQEVNRNNYFKQRSLGSKKEGTGPLSPVEDQMQSIPYRSGPFHVSDNLQNVLNCLNAAMLRLCLPHLRKSSRGRFGGEDRHSGSIPERGQPGVCNLQAAEKGEWSLGTEINAIFPTGVVQRKGKRVGEGRMKERRGTGEGKRAGIKSERGKGKKQKKKWRQK